MGTVAKLDSLELYLKEVSRYPVLDREEERRLALKYREEGDLEAARLLVLSNLRFVVKMAAQYASYGVPLLDLIQEGTLGLMKAVRSFDPRKGTRLISYAVWWIKAYIHNFIMRSWSVVKLGTTEAQRKLFHKLGRKKRELDLAEDAPLEDDEIARLADAFGVKESDVRMMETRTQARDLSLDVHAPDGDGSLAYLDLLVDDRLTQEELVGEVEMERVGWEAIRDGMAELTPRERVVVEGRYLCEKPKKLHELGRELGVSKERVRQIEASAVRKLRAIAARRLEGAGAIECECTC